MLLDRDRPVHDLFRPKVMAACPRITTDCRCQTPTYRLEIRQRRRRVNP